MNTLKDYVEWGMTHCDKTASAEGVPLVMENCVKNKKMKQLEVCGNSIQNGTPSPEAPVEVESVGEKCTKNLFDVEQFEAELQHGYVLNNDGIKTVDTISTYSTYRIPIYAEQSIHIYGWFQRFYVYDANDIFVKRVNNSLSTIMNSTYTPTEDGYIRLQIRNENYNTNKGEEQIESGSVATEYEPYGKYKIPVTVRGKNMIPFSISLANNYSEYSVSGGHYTIRGNVGSGRIQASTGQLMFPSLYKIETYGMEVKAGKTYRIAFDYLLKERGAYDNYISMVIYGTSNAVRLTNGYVKGVVGETISYNLSFTSEYDEKVCLCFRINNNLVTLSNIRFEDADVKLITTNVYLNEPLRKIGDYADYIDFKGKKVVRSVYECVVANLDSTKYNLSSLNAGTDLVGFRYTYKGEMLRYKLPSIYVKGNSICNMYPVVYSTQRVDKTLSGGSSNSATFDLIDMNYTTVDEWLARLDELYQNGTPLKVTHAIATPYEEPIECELPTLPAKTSIVEIDTSLLPSNIKGKYIKR